MTFQQYPFKGGVPTGTTAQRPTSPVTGDVFYNGSSGILEIYNGTDWVPCSAPSGTPVVSAADVGTSRAYTSGAISFTFTPQTTGGAPLGYTGVATTASTATVYQTTTSSTTVTLSVGLPGTYTFYGNSYNGFGTSPNAVPSTIEVTTIPQAPTIGSASTSSVTTDITVTWTLGNNGGKNLSSITITPFLNGTTAQTSQTAATTSSTSHVFTGLTAGSAYTFKVKTTNANGTSLDSNATNSITIPTLFDIMIVAGGGGSTSGGGGAGGFRVVSASLGSGTTYTATVGGGGAGGTGAGGSNAAVGVNSSVSGTGLTTITSSGGGRGGPINADEAMSGGSGGGGGRASVGFWGAKSGNAGGYSPAEGTSGGRNLDQFPYNAGGGGGATQAGENATTSQSADQGGKGGDGSNAYSSWGSATASGENISGTYWYAGGGGGGGDGGSSPRGLGGKGGGANGSYNANGNNGTANTGGGAGGNGSTGTGGSGGSGIIIFRIAGSFTASATTGSPTRYETGGYSYYKFTGTGTITI